MTNDTALAVIEPQNFNERQVEIIKNQIAKGASEDELNLFLEVCKMTGLNPFMKQIYAIKRGGNMTIQTGIDGYRLAAARTKQLAGSDDPVYDVEDADHPGKASVTVWRFVNGQRVPFTATARWKEYNQPNGDQWRKMPYLMLGKCAEALALRKAFPAELSGVYTGEEMDQADNDTTYIDAAPTPIRPSARVQEDGGREWTKADISALFGRWQKLQPALESARMPDVFGKAMRDFCGHAAPFSNTERDRFASMIERQERGELTPDPEQPHDLRTLEGASKIGA